MGEPALELSGLKKSYGDVVAVAGLDLAVGAGEVVALLGENGAGKSTVVNMVAGLVRPDGGEIRIEGYPVELDSARTAGKLGIGVVHQHYALVPQFTVAESVALGQVGAGRWDRVDLARRLRDLGAELGLQVDPQAHVGSLDVAAQQRVEILRAVMDEPHVLILDEPSAVLTDEDTQRLFQIIGRLKARGVAILLITHRLADVDAVCDRAVVLHAGQRVLDRPVEKCSHAGLIALMVTGREDGEPLAAATQGLVAQKAVATTRDTSADADAVVSMSVQDVTLLRANGSLAVAGLSFDLRSGEILAVAGVDGNGQSELVACMAGLSIPAGGAIRRGTLSSSAQSVWTPQRLRAAGVAHVAEDRRSLAIVAELPLTENMLLGQDSKPRYSRRGLIDRRRARRDTEAAIRDYAIRTTGPGQQVGLLSGGNQQKLVLARELLGDPEVVLAAHPSRGLDIRTIGFVQEKLRERRAAGCAILLVSADLDEVMALADRIVVLGGGHSRGPVASGEMSRRDIGAWMAGQ